MPAKLTDARLRGLKASGKTQRIAGVEGLYIELISQGLDIGGWPIVLMANRKSWLLADTQKLRLPKP